VKLDFTDRNPRSWIASGGLACPMFILAHKGLPAYESARGALFVMENLVVFQATQGFDLYSGFAGGRDEMLFGPFSYAQVAQRAPTNLTALHDADDAVWSWRPLLYTLNQDGITRLGSHQELAWRWGLAAVMENNRAAAIELLKISREAAESERPIREYAQRLTAIAERHADLDSKLRMAESRERSREILWEHLSAWQRLDLLAWGRFNVSGKINPQYRIDPGNGFDIVDPVTHESLVTFCLHPDDWMPFDDVALATKLAIDAGRESEQELLEAARPRVNRVTRRPNQRLRRAAELESALGAF
jgi:hypothetical protein